MTAEGMAWLGAGLGIGLAAMGTGLAIGILSAKSVESAARQPEAANTIQRMMILAIAFIEALCLYALVVCLFLVFKTPAGEGAADGEPPSGPIGQQVDTSR